MVEFFKKMIGDKKEYKEMMRRVEVLPENYRFVFKKIQEYMWNFAAGDGYDMLKIHYELIELFETGAADGKGVLEITGDDVGAFCDELLLSARTYTASWRNTLNRDIMEKIGSKKNSIQNTPK